MSEAPSIITPAETPTVVRPQAKKSSLAEGLKIVQQATVEDQKGNIDEAVQLYSLALELFQAAADETEDQNVKDLIAKKSKNYISRMEHLRLIILKDQFPEVPKQEDDLEELEKQFADIPVSDNGYKANRQQQIEDELIPKRAPPEVPEDDNDDPPSYASPSPPPVRNQSAVVSNIGPQNPEVVKAIEEAANWISQAKEAEAKGDLINSVAKYKRGLKYLFSAYNIESDKQVKELVRIKYNCLVSRVEEVESQLSIPDDANTKALVSRMGIVEEYTNKARKLADGLDLAGSIKYYNMAMGELNKMIGSKEFESSKKWLAKRALVTERRIGGISAVVKIVKVALPYPWSKIFGVIEFGLRVSGVTTKAQSMIDNKLSKMAGVDPETLDSAAPVGDSDMVGAIDLGKSPSSSKKDKKKKDKKKK